ncbi:TlpA family protein disulfide reductase [Kineococcus rubinsiae]|uniref:TlpA family protein disulfide reductase n=1 Tax=Kineococcus rubinsiae TaxID=2609562 RepID=UPI0014317005|nr:TlpA disulfide reductase family protein [Kineococcus rubinsiae]
MRGRVPPPAPGPLPARLALAPRRVVLASLVAAGLAGGTAYAGVRVATHDSLVGALAPPLAGRALDGSWFDLRSWRGGPVLLSVWTPGAAHCREQLRLLSSVQQDLLAGGVRIVGLATTPSPDACREALAASGAEGLLALPDEDGSRADAWGVRQESETFLVSGGGTVLDHLARPVDAPWLAQHATSA